MQLLCLPCFKKFFKCIFYLVFVAPLSAAKAKEVIAFLSVVSQPPYRVFVGPISTEAWEVVILSTFSVSKVVKPFHYYPVLSPSPLPLWIALFSLLFPESLGVGPWLRGR